MSAQPLLEQTPYPGIRPFLEHEGGYFFGRTGQIKEIIDHLRRHAFVAVIGGSGSGKSSMIRAGVIPFLRGSALTARSDIWAVVTVRPGTAPMGNLVRELEAVLIPGGGTERRREIEASLGWQVAAGAGGRLSNFLAGFRDALDFPGESEETAKRLRPAANLLLVVDQFEELFRPEVDTAESNHLIGLLQKAYGEPVANPGLHVVLTMRSEDLHHCQRHGTLARALNETFFLCRYLDQAELEEAIVQPARLALQDFGSTVSMRRELLGPTAPFERSVVDRLLDAAAGPERSDDHLPLLQHTLRVLWRRAAERVKSDPNSEFVVREDDLDKIAEPFGFGGASLGHVLERTADGIFEQMPENDKRAAQIMFRLLATIDAQGNPKRSFTDVGEIRAVAGRRSRSVTDAHIKGALDALSDPYPFLWQRSSGDIDVQHEALIRNWERFRRELRQEGYATRALEEVTRAYARRERQLARGLAAADQLEQEARATWGSSKLFPGWKVYRSKARAIGVRFAARLRHLLLGFLPLWDVFRCHDWLRSLASPRFAERYSSVLNRALGDEEPEISIEPDEVPDRLRQFWARSRWINVALTGVMLLLLGAGFTYVIYQWGETRGLRRQADILTRHALAGDLGDLASIVRERATKSVTTAEEEIAAVADAVTLFDALGSLDPGEDPSQMDANSVVALGEFEKALNRVSDATDEMLRSALHGVALRSTRAPHTQHAAGLTKAITGPDCRDSSDLRLYDVLTTYGVRPSHNSITIYFTQTVWLHRAMTNDASGTKPALQFIFTDDDCKLLLAVDSQWGPPPGATVRLNSSLTAVTLQNANGDSDFSQIFRVSWVPRCVANERDEGVCSRLVPHALILPIHAYLGASIDDFELISDHLPIAVPSNTLEVKWAEQPKSCITAASLGGKCLRWVDTAGSAVVEVTTEKGQGALVHQIRLFGPARGTAEEDLPIVETSIPYGVEIDKVGFDKDDRLVLQAKGHDMAYTLIWRRDKLLSIACESLLEPPDTGRTVYDLMSDDIKKFMAERFKELTSQVIPCKGAGATVRGASELARDGRTTRGQSRREAS